METGKVIILRPGRFQEVSGAVDCSMARLTIHSLAHVTAAPPRRKMLGEHKSPLRTRGLRRGYRRRHIGVKPSSHRLQGRHNPTAADHFKGFARDYTVEVGASGGPQLAHTYPGTLRRVEQAIIVDLNYPSDNGRPRASCRNPELGGRRVTRGPGDGR
jgi:hypothetical protein